MRQSLSLALVLVFVATGASAQALRVAEVRVEGKPVTGAVTIVRFVPPERTPIPMHVQVGQTLDDGPEIGIPARTVVVLQSPNDNRIELSPGSRFVPAQVSTNGEAYVFDGDNARFDVRRALSFFNVEFNRFVALVRGTVFYVEAGADGAGALRVESGRVTVQREVPTLLQDTGRQLDMLEHDVLDAEARPRATWSATEAVRRYTHSDEAFAQYTADLERAEANTNRDGQLMAYNNLGLVWLALGVPANAEAQFLRMLSLAQAGQDDAWRARALNNLGAAALERNDPKTAVKYLEAALEANRVLSAAAGKRRVAQVEGNLGIAWRRLGDNAKAREYTERSLEANQQLAAGRDSAAVARNLESLSNITIDEGKARQLQLRALEMRERIFGSSPNPDIASSYINLGLLATRSSDDRSAATYYGRAVAIREQLFGAQPHVLLAEALARHGAALCRAGDVPTGLAQNERAFAIRMKLTQGPVDPAVIESYQQIAACWAQAARLKDPGAEGKVMETLQRLKAYQETGKPGT